MPMRAAGHRTSSRPSQEPTDSHSVSRQVAGSLLAGVPCRYGSAMGTPHQSPASRLVRPASPRVPSARPGLSAAASTTTQVRGTTISRVRSRFWSRYGPPADLFATTNSTRIRAIPAGFSRPSASPRAAALPPFLNAPTIVPPPADSSVSVCLDSGRAGSEASHPVQRVYLRLPVAAGQPMPHCRT